MPTLSLRLDEQQLLEMAAKARAHGCKRGYLLKADSSKLKRLNQRWCSVFNNTLFYFESESVPKPLGVVFLEGTVCRPVEQIGLPGREVEGAFCVASASPDSSATKSHYFMAQNDKERDSWIEAISKANMSRLQHDLEELKEKCTRLEAQMVLKLSEVEHFKRASEEAHEEVTHLKKILESEIPRRRSSSFLPSPPHGSPPPNSDPMDYHARVLQGYVRSWLIRRKWRQVVEDYVASPQANLIRQRNQMIWKFIASEEDYVSQLVVLSEEYKKQCEIGARSCKPPLTLDQCATIFRNSEQLLLFHQLFLRALHSRIEKWPVVVFGDMLELFFPVMSIYHHFVGSHSHAYDLLLSLRTQASFKSFLDQMQRHTACNNLSLETVLLAPLKRIESYIQDLQELRSHTPPEHVDYKILQDVATELEIIQKTVTDEVSQSETLRQVLEVENMIEDGCEVLLDKEQTLIRQGVLHQLRVDDKLKSPVRSSAKVRSQPRHCFLFCKHLLITARVQKKPQDQYRIIKLVPLAKCTVSEVKSDDTPEVHYRGIRVSCGESDSLILLTNSVNEKAQWLADFSQCVENERQNKILQCQSVGEPVELSSKFIRYSTFKTGKEQLVNCGNLESLLERLVKVSHYGLDFLNTFLMTFPLYTTAHHVLDSLAKSYHDCLNSRERKRSGSIVPQDAVRDAREIHTLPRSATMSPPGNGIMYGSHLTIPRPNGLLDPVPHSRTASDSNMSTNPSISGIFFAIKHWISKHFYHFQDDAELASKLEQLLDHAYMSPLLTMNEKNAAVEASSMYRLQKEGGEEHSFVMDYMNPHSPVHLPQKPFECLLLWAPRETAEQLCIIENTLFSRIGNSELLRYFITKGEEKAKVAPNLNAIFDHFNRMSMFFMWSIAHQRYFADRTKILEFLIEVTQECVNLQNYSSFMQLMSALEHGSTQKFKQAWEFVPRNLKQQFKNLKKLSATDARFRELRTAMKKAIPPSVPYLGIALNELSGVVESQPNFIDDGLINFSKMRRCTRLVTAVLQHQKEPYDFQFVPEISKVLLCTHIPGDEDTLYQFVDQIKDK